MEFEASDLSYSKFKKCLFECEPILIRTESFDLEIGLNTWDNIARRQFPELIEADRLKYNHPAQALEIYTEVALKTTNGNLYARHQRLFCLRQMKEYDAERVAVLDIIKQVKYGLDNGWDCYSQETLETYKSRLRSLENYFIPRRDKRLKLLAEKEARRVERENKKQRNS